MRLIDIATGQSEGFVTTKNETTLYAIQYCPTQFLNIHPIDGCKLDGTTPINTCIKCWEREYINENENIAVLNITGTESYHILFIKSYSKISEIEDELKDADAKLNYSSKKILEEHL